jgi:hypothetical protein
MITIPTNALPPRRRARESTLRSPTIWTSGAAALGQVFGQSGLASRRAELLSLAESMQANQPALAGRLRAASRGDQCD